MMTNDPSPPATDERWIDAALLEHARLGCGDDEELVMRILSETVHRPAAARAAKPSFGWRGAASLAAGVAAFLALALLVLSSLPARVGSGREGIEDELRFAIRLSPTTEDGARPASPTPPTVAVTARPVSSDAITAAAPGEIALSIARLEAGSAPDFIPALAEPPRRGVRHESLRIRADRSESGPGGIVYSGEVVVEHAAFRFEADSVELPATAGEEAPTLLARGVRLEQSSPRRLVEAESLRFDPAASSFELAGVLRFECEKGTLARFAPGDRLHLGDGGFSIESAPVEVHASPMPASRR
jgi:hypothetical protein